MFREVTLARCADKLDLPVVVATCARQLFQERGIHSAEMWKGKASRIGRGLGPWTCCWRSGRTRSAQRSGGHRDHLRGFPLRPPKLCALSFGSWAGKAPMIGHELGSLTCCWRSGRTRSAQRSGGHRDDLRGFPLCPPKLTAQSFGSWAGKAPMIAHELGSLPCCWRSGRTRSAQRSGGHRDDLRGFPLCPPKLCAQDR